MIIGSELRNPDALPADGPRSLGCALRTTTEASHFDPLRTLDYDANSIE